MDSNLFIEWFQQQFVRSVRKFLNDKGLEKEAVLLLDNAPSHPTSAVLQSDDGMIKTMFLPPNTTAIIQPMDQAVLDPWQRRYNRKLLAHIILKNESTKKPVPEVLKAITMKNLMLWMLHCVGWSKHVEMLLTCYW